MASRPRTLGALAVVVAALAPLPAAHAAEVTCRGLPATIVGEPDATIHGTAGDDVIVASYTKGGEVDAGAGDDVVCVVDGPLPTSTVGESLLGLVLGDGDDVADTTSLRASAAGVLTYRGTGHDSVYGGPASDFVTPAVAGDQVQLDPVADLLVTGGGADKVSSGAPGEISADVVDLGPGNDRLVYSGDGQGPGGSLTGGEGQDQLLFAFEGPFGETEPPVPAGALVLDNRAQSATVAGAPYLAWSGFEAFNLAHLRNRATILGSDLAEHVSLGSRTELVRLRGGDDRLTTPYDFPASGSASGGPGIDRIEADTYGDAKLDLRHSLRTVVIRKGRGTMNVKRFEDADVHGVGVVTVRGNDDPNVIRALGSGLLAVQAGGGADHVTIGKQPQFELTDDSSRVVRGGGGDDVLVGSPLPDELWGGSGHDVVRAGKGHDRCRAEVVRSCEELL